MKKLLFLFDDKKLSYANLLNGAISSQDLPEGASAVLETSVLMEFPKHVLLLARLIESVQELHGSYKIYWLDDDLCQFDIASLPPKSKF